MLEGWRAAFTQRFGIPPPAPTLHACWTQCCMRAARLGASQRLKEPPDAAVVAARAALVLAPLLAPLPAQHHQVLDRCKAPYPGALFAAPHPAAEPVNQGRTIDASVLDCVAEPTLSILSF